MSDSTGFKRNETAHSAAALGGSGLKRLRILLVGLAVASLGLLVAAFAIPVSAHEPAGQETAPVEDAWDVMYEACLTGDWAAMTEAAEELHDADTGSLVDPTGKSDEPDTDMPYAGPGWDVMNEVMDDVHRDAGWDTMNEVMDDVHQDTGWDAMNEVMDDVHQDTGWDAMNEVMDDVHSDGDDNMPAPGAGWGATGGHMGGSAGMSMWRR